MVFSEHIAHCFQRGASSDKVVEDNAVKLIGEIVHCEHSPNTLLGMAESYILVKRDVQLLRYQFANARCEVLDEVAAFGSGDNTPRTCSKSVA